MVTQYTPFTLRKFSYIRDLSNINKLINIRHSYNSTRQTSRMARNNTGPIFVVHNDLPIDLDMRDIPVIICDTLNTHVHGRVAGAQRREGIWFIWVKSQEARDYLMQNVKVLKIKNLDIEMHDEYPIIQTRYSNEKILFKDLPFDVPDSDILDYLFSQPDIQVKTRHVI